MSSDHNERVQQGDVNPEITEELTDEELESVDGGFRHEHTRPAAHDLSGRIPVVGDWDGDG